MMLTYYVVAFVLLLFCFLDAYAHSKYMQPAYLFIGFVILACMAGFRGFWFTDYGNYVGIYGETVHLYDFLYYGGNPPRIHGEFLYLFLNTLVKTFFDSSIPVFVIVAALAVGLNCVAFKKFSPYPLLSLLWYFSHLFLYKELIQIRAGLASAIVLCSVYFIVHKKPLQYTVAIILAFLFHVGAIIALPVYWVCKKDFGKKMLFFPLIVGFALGLTSWLDSFLNLMGAANVLPQKLAWYQETYSDDALGVLNPMTLKQLFFCFFLVGSKEILKTKFKYFYPIMVMYILSTAWLFALQEIPILAARIATFLSAGDPVVIAFLISLFKEKKVVSMGIAFLSIVILFMNLELRQHWVEYHVIFDFF
ncbi:MAG: EpsG family protein [Deltaproteobacteria bacterium]|nr:EpsG family protein [Deltaproteobacteria bacterium]